MAGMRNQIENGVDKTLRLVGLRDGRSIILVPMSRVGIRSSNMLKTTTKNRPEPAVYAAAQ
jgi:hypothetical protein